MKKYDYKLAKQLISDSLENIEEATLGMREDWFWTAETVYSGTKGLMKDLENPELAIGGINSSDWATPTLYILYKDGTEEFKDCYIEEGISGTKPKYPLLGILSTPAQENIEYRVRKSKFKIVK